MPQKVLRFTGINRKVSEFQSNGACEELINVRPTATGVEVVKPKKELFGNVEYDIYTHSFGNTSNFIGIKHEQDVFEMYLVSNAGSLSLIAEIPSNGPEYSIAFIGNQILFSHNTYLYAFDYKDNKYERFDAAVPDDLDISYTVSYGYGYSKEGNPENSNPNDNSFKASVMEHWSSALGQNSKVDETFGAVLVAFNVSLSDGTEFWTNKWIYVNPFLNDNVKKMIYYEDGNTKRFTFNSYSINFTISKKQFSSSGVRNLVKSVNVYATRPVFPYDIDSMTAVTDNVHDREIYAKTMDMKGTGITKQLLYFQQSIPVGKIENGNVSFKLDFGESQAGEKVLEVDNGPVKRAGEMISYNNRAHFYNSYATIVPQSVVCRSNVNYDFQTRAAYVHLECNDKTVVCKTTAKVPAIASTTSLYKISCCYPDARAKKILIATDENETDFCTINLEQSERYNFSWGEANYYSSYVVSDAVLTPSYSVAEPNAINVSAQYNAFVFPIEYSYSVGGRILDIATSYLPISSTQVGQYPLTVFTSSGIYALEQGSGSSLYGSMVPLQPQVISGKAAPTPFGTFFISSNNLYVLSGRESMDVSQALTGSRETGLINLDSYRKLCCGENRYLYNFSPLLSGEDFKEFIQDATLTYDQYNNELFISSGNVLKGYSYVFNLNSKQFHKIANRYTATQNGARYVVEWEGTDRRVVDLFSEENTERSILLQSRPFSLDAFNSHINRLIFLVDAKLKDDQNLCLSVFGSDNLNDWKCIISSQKHDTTLRQIRTNRAAKSYKDYIILINGTVDADTDLSEIIADYSVVSRRLG
jgi:hypothetical protein